MKALMILALVAIPVSASAAAVELRGADIANMLSGKTFTCEDKKKTKKISMQFPKLSGTVSEIPYNYTIDGKTLSNAYVIKSDGRMFSKQSGQSRKIMKLSPKHVQIFGRSGQYWVCAAT